MNELDFTKSPCILQFWKLLDYFDAGYDRFIFTKDQLLDLLEQQNESCMAQIIRESEDGGIFHNKSEWVH